jgi:hypothetical protein
MQTRHLGRAGSRLVGRLLLGRPLLVEGRACSGISGQGPYAGINKQGSYEGHGKTSVAILNEDAHGINMIDSYAQDGFRLNDDTKILGPCIVFPTAVLGPRPVASRVLTPPPQDGGSGQLPTSPRSP